MRHPRNKLRRFLIARGDGINPLAPAALPKAQKITTRGYLFVILWEA